jgi:type III secretion system (T3SS) SseB-like protein
VLGLSGGDPSFRDDDGAADPDVAAALGAFASGNGSEREALAALAASRLLVPVVAVLAGESGSPDARKASEMAMPTLIGLDGRRAIPAFTCVDSMHRWRKAARPVPAAAQHVWQAAAEDSCAVVIDVAGPVRLAVEGARLAALAGGTAVPAAWADPDVREVVSDVLASELTVAAFELFPGDPDCDLVIALTLAPGSAERDVTALAAEMGGAVMTRLGVRLRRGVAVRLGTGT